MNDTELPPSSDSIRCSRQGCFAVYEGRRGCADALAAGWSMIAGSWLCAPCAELGRQRVIADMLDGIDQSEPEGILEIDLGGESG